MRYEVRMKYGDTLSVIEVNTKKEVYTFLKDFTGLRVSEIYRRNMISEPYIWREGRMNDHYWMVIDKDKIIRTEWEVGLFSGISKDEHLCKKHIPKHSLLKKPIICPETGCILNLRYLHILYYL
jgi:hypothetical protein